MAIWGHDLSKIELKQINELVNDKERENLYLDYKENLPDFKIEQSKRDFLHDITAFANANGGDIIYGIKDKKDTKGLATAIPEKIVGLDSSINSDQMQRRIEDIAITNIDPPLRGLLFRWIDYKTEKILILRIPKSWAKPHAVQYKHDIRIYIRTASGKKPLEYREMKHMIIESSTMIDRIKNFRNERLNLLKEGKLHLHLAPSLAVIHMVPFASFEQIDTYSVQFLEEKINNLSCFPLGYRGIGNTRYNFDGFLALGELGRYNKKKITSYLLAFRNAIIESACNAITNKYDSAYAFPVIELEKFLICAYKQYLDFYKSINLPLPLIVFISILGTQNKYIVFDDIRHGGESGPIDRPELLMQEIIVESYDTKPKDVLKPAFDTIWNAADMSRSFSYNEDGSYKFDYS